MQTRQFSGVHWLRRRLRFLRSFSPVLLCMILLLHVILFSAAHAEGRRVACLVGASIYPGSLGTATLAASDDASRLANLLRVKGWIVYLMNDAQPKMYLPKRKNILRQLGVTVGRGGQITFTNTASPGLGRGALTAKDTVLFYFAGHSLQSNDQDMTQYLLPTDVVKRGNTFDRGSLISLGLVTAALGATNAGHIIILTDTGRDMTSVTKDSSNTLVHPSKKTVSQKLPNSKLIVFQSCGFGASSWEMSDERSGVFSYFLCLALMPENMQDTDSNHDGKVSLAETVDYVRSRTVNYVQGFLHQSQMPEVTIEGPSAWLGFFDISQVLVNSPHSAPIRKRVYQKANGTAISCPLTERLN